MPFDDRDFPGLPRGERSISPHSRRIVALWLYAIAFMILVMVALGGATRLTGSGLSIMEWAPVTGALPPLNEAEWERLFDLYKRIPQYGLLNDGLTLDGFRQIFWLEWVHRLWGRLIGAAFTIPLIWFALTHRIDRRLFPRLVAFFVLGGLQGTVGWFMVASGFEPGSVAVAPVRLVLHLALALILYAAVLWTALTLRPPGPRIAEPSAALQAFAWGTLGLTAATIVAGGFVAGLRAGLTYNTFPLMDGQLIPDGYADLEPFARNMIENIATVQFNHRLLASITLLAATGLTIVAWPYRSQLGWRTGFAGCAAGLQYILGVGTLLLVVPIDLAVLHQVGATILLTSVLLIVHASRPLVARPDVPGIGGAGIGGAGIGLPGRVRWWARGGKPSGASYAWPNGFPNGIRALIRNGLPGGRPGGKPGGRGHGQNVRGIPPYRSVTPSASPPGTEDSKS
jgi:cytochrome c oxidase assembly protein subunit 15